MLCKKPVRVGVNAYPCLQCMPCRMNRRRVWKHRIWLEAMKHERNSFVTLTYDDEHLPAGGTLVPRDFQLFIKRLRFCLSDVVPFRYYGVGEYGDTSWRPHYHAALFGVGPELAQVVNKVWGLGHTMSGDLSLASAEYIAGYVTKKMTKKDDVRLQGRHPEFARMSLKPGIGADAMSDVGASLTGALERYSLSPMDVPCSLRHGGKDLPLGRY